MIFFTNFVPYKWDKTTREFVRDPMPKKEVDCEECVIHFECRCVHKNDVVPREIAESIIPQFYPRGGFPKRWRMSLGWISR